MRKYWYTRFTILLAVLMFGLTNVEAKIVTNQSVKQEEVVSKTKSKLSFKEKIALRKVLKQKQKSPKKVTGQTGFFSKLFLGIILIVLGALVIIGGIFSVSLGGLLLGIAGIVVGAIVIVWGVLDIFFD